MRKLVYLFELDSVHFSEDETMSAQHALFEEIVLKGNSVVLSFNQLTDSEAFLYMVRDKKTYDSILELFELGALKVAPFRPTEDTTEEVMETDIRTASQYMQKAILKNINSKNEDFIFSGLPIKGTEKELLKKILRVLQYDDINILLEHMEKEKDKKEKERLEYIIRYIKMILVLSSKENARNPIKTSFKHKFIDFYERIYLIIQEEIKLGKSQDLLEEVINELNKIRIKIPQEKINDRSSWLTEVRALQKSNKQVLVLAEVIINLCYNYTVENSIQNVYTSYNNIEDQTFKQNFLKHLEEHMKNKVKNNGIEKYRNKQPKWKTAVRIIKDENNMDKYFLKYVKNIEWSTRLLLQLIRRLVVAIIYIITFCLASSIVENLQNIFNNTLGNLNKMVIAVVSTILFGIISSLVAYFLKLPDILESIKNLGNGVFDYIIIKTTQRDKERRK